MSPRQQKRLMLVFSLIFGLGLGFSLILYALSKNINLFYTPTELTEKKSDSQSLRVGGMVVKNSVIRQKNLQVEFLITDYQKEIKVIYEGILPDLFREGQGIVALGRLHEGIFYAHEVLAKHDEKYMPPEVAAAIKGKKNDHS